MTARRGSGPTARPTPAPPPGPRAGRTLAERPVDVAMVVGSVAFVAAGLAWPQAADMLLRLLFVSLAAGWVATRAYRSVHPVQSSERRYSPFDYGLADAAPPAAPRALRRLASELHAADRPYTWRETIPATAVRTIRTDAARRLNEHHGLTLRNPGHHARIRSIVSDPTWHVIRPQGAGARPGGGAAPTSVPLSGLGHILDELERL